MIDCAYIGDSIAVGLQQVDHHCVVHAKVGAGSDFIVNNYSSKDREAYTIVSMGSNWPSNPNNYRNASKLRASFAKAQLVIWILPYDRKAAAVIRQVAKEHGDAYVDLAVFPSKDHVHPRNYKQVSKRVDDCVTYYYD